MMESGHLGKTEIHRDIRVLLEPLVTALSALQTATHNKISLEELRAFVSGQIQSTQRKHSGPTPCTPFASIGPNRWAEKITEACHNLFGRKMMINTLAKVFQEKNLGFMSMLQLQTLHCDGHFQDSGVFTIIMRRYLNWRIFWLGFRSVHCRYKNW